MTEGLIYDEQGGGGCVDQIFTLKQIDEKAREKKCRVYVGFMHLETAYDIVNTEALWHIVRMYDVANKLIMELT